MVIWFILIELLLAVLGGTIFFIISLGSKCKVTWGLIGGVLGLCKGLDPRGAAGPSGGSWRR